MNSITVESERCKGCYLCIAACREKCIEVAERRNAYGCCPVRFVGAASCTACRRCALVCPDVAIEVCLNGTSDRGIL